MPTAVEAVRLEVVRIRFLRQHGYEDSDETMRLSHNRDTVLVGTHDNNVGATIGRPLLAAGAMRLEILPIHLLRQPEAVIPTKPLLFRSTIVRCRYCFLRIFVTVLPQ